MPVQLPAAVVLLVEVLHLGYQVLQLCGQRHEDLLAAPRPRPRVQDFDVDGVSCKKKKLDLNLCSYFGPKSICRRSHCFIQQEPRLSYQIQGIVSNISVSFLLKFGLLEAELRKSEQVFIFAQRCKLKLNLTNKDRVFFNIFFNFIWKEDANNKKTNFQITKNNLLLSQFLKRNVHIFRGCLLSSFWFKC